MTGVYRTRDGGSVNIIGLHPKFPEMVISDRWHPTERPGAYWWDTGVHPHESANDLIDVMQAAGIEEEAA